MKKIRINTVHRYIGIAISPFIALQTITGLFLDYGLFRRGSFGPGTARLQETLGVWDKFLTKTHFGSGLTNDTYHLLLGAGIIWMVVSGWVLYLRVRRNRKSLSEHSVKS
jgi:uncharacterized iron-regulated membrane protein